MAYLYRFRSAEHLLDKYQELEKQEIYLAPPDELNDPMEGYKDVYWLGDPVLWRNFLRHYVFCLAEAIGYTRIGLVDTDDLPFIPVQLGRNTLPDGYAADIETATTAFLRSEPAVSFVETLSELQIPLRREGVVYFLAQIHLCALRVVLATLEARGYLRPGTDLNIPDDIDRAVVKVFKTMRDNASTITPEFKEHFPDAAGRALEQTQLEVLFNARAEGFPRRRAFFVFEFPKYYVDTALRDMIHPPWFTACFAGTCTDASMWGTYGNAHTGAALMLDVGALESAEIELETPIGVGPKIIRGKTQHRFQRADYTNKAPELDFFKFLGQLPEAQIQSEWLLDENGEKSERLSAIFTNNLDGWREELSRITNVGATTKLRDWKHEDEYRIVWSTNIKTEKIDRKMRYEFSALAGIVFGMSMSVDDKISIMEIIETKCKAAKRTDFKFLEAFYNRRSGQMDVLPVILSPRR